MIEFIQESGIVIAMVGLLNVPRGTKIYYRLLKEGRVSNVASGDNAAINFTPKMDYDVLIKGYRDIICTVYSPEQYYARIKQFLKDYKQMRTRMFQFHFCYLKSFFKSIFFLGIIGKERIHYWRLFFWSLLHCPHSLPLVIKFTIYGFHFRRISNNTLLISKRSNISKEININENLNKNYRGSDLKVYQIIEQIISPNNYG